MTANCNKELIVLKHTDFPTENGLIYTDFFLNILRTQNTALRTVMRGGAGLFNFVTSVVYKLPVSRNQGGGGKK